MTSRERRAARSRDFFTPAPAGDFLDAMISDAATSPPRFPSPFDLLAILAALVVATWLVFPPIH